MSAAAPPPPKRASPIPADGCSPMPPRRAWFSSCRREHRRLLKVCPGCDGRFAVSVTRKAIKPRTFVFEDDGLVPNNPLPFVVYTRAVDVDNDHPEKTIEGL